MRTDIECICGKKLGEVDSHENVRGVYLKCNSCKREIEIINDGKKQQLKVRALSIEESKVKRDFYKCICKRKLVRIDKSINIRGVYIKCMSCAREMEIINIVQSPETRIQNPEIRVQKRPESRDQRSEFRDQLAYT